MAIKLSNLVAAAQAVALTTAVDAGAGAGTLKIYDGTAPANADTAIGAQVLLVNLTLGDPSFGSPATVTGGKTVTANAIASTTAVATGTASWFRVLDSDANVILQGTVTATGGGGDCTLATVALTSGGDVEVVSMTFKQLTGA